MKAEDKEGKEVASGVETRVTSTTGRVNRMPSFLASRKVLPAVVSTGSATSTEGLLLGALNAL